MSLNREAVRALAMDAGFSDAGLVALPHANETLDATRFTDWIHEGRAGSMNYLTRRDEDGNLVRSRVAIPFPWARSAIVCLTQYDDSHPRSVNEAPPDAAWIARYAWSSRTDPSGARRPSDYHKVLLKRLRALETALRANGAAFESRAYVDTGPIAERALAVAAGLGWTAKNTCLVSQTRGSFVFLSVLITSLAIEASPATLRAADRCGTCRRCIDACPTNALIAPYQMDATRCISYLTIEHRGAISDELKPGMGRQVFGCDICQDVCPWNRKRAIGVDPDLEARTELVNPGMEWLANLDEAAFEETFNGSPVRRAGFNGLRRNVAVAMGNSGMPHWIELLQEWSDAADEGLRDASCWALRRLKSATAGDEED